eukprot:Phypoly_transcript_04602.p1 GENE.Phypoly_transcript_04602~~Phypoly_transcript_04602.p1  ORF type:complete len:449 (+),score=62.33 Phypoly_transcript_04602:650-1996(+)
MKKGKVFLVLLCTLVVGVAVWVGMSKGETLRDYQPPNPDQWWGLGAKPEHEDKTIRKFEIKADKEMLADLQARLGNTRYFEAIVEEDKWVRGTLPHFTKDLVEYWQNGFDWEKQVNYLNSYDQYVTNIFGLDVHFVHVKAKKNKDTQVLPLLLLHGWPGSFFEFYGAIPYLTDPGKSGSNLAFDVVVPSLPGFGFSEPTRKKGLSGSAISQIFAKLMERLGYTSYIAQGGDYGSFFARMMPTYDPDHCIGVHLNMFMTPTPWYAPFQMTLAYLLGPGAVFTEHQHNRFFPLANYFKEVAQQTGYMHIQATRPYSLGHGLSDSPAGLAAYIAEKFYFWADNGGEIYNALSKDQILTNVMIYWSNNTIASSMNYYYEIIADVKFMHLLTKEEVHAPTALADFNKEIQYAHNAAWAHIPFKRILQISILRVFTVVRSESVCWYHIGSNQTK